MGVGVFTVQEQLCKCYNCRRFLGILANFASRQSHPCLKFIDPNTNYKMGFHSPYHTAGYIKTYMVLAQKLVLNLMFGVFWR